METEHISLIVTSNTEKAHKEATKLYKKLSYLISPIVKGMSNFQESFFIAPDGSFKGNTGAAATTTYRERFKEWCRENKADYVEIKTNYYETTVDAHIKTIRKSPPKKEEYITTDVWFQNKMETFD